MKFRNLVFMHSIIAKHVKKNQFWIKIWVPEENQFLLWKNTAKIHKWLALKCIIFKIIKIYTLATFISKFFENNRISHFCFLWLWTVITLIYLKKCNSNSSRSCWIQLKHYSVHFFSDFKQRNVKILIPEES